MLTIFRAGSEIRPYNLPHVWVRNRLNGSVEAIVEGEKTAVEKMLQWFYQGSPNSIVEKVHTTEESPAGDSSTFEIHYY